MFGRGLSIKTMQKKPRPGSSAHSTIKKSTILQDRRWSNPEAGPSKPRSIRSIRSEPGNDELRQLMSGEYNWKQPWTNQPRETDSLITNQHCDLSEDPTPDDKGKSKEVINDEIPTVQGHCEGCNPASSATIARILAGEPSDHTYNLENKEDAKVDFGTYDWNKPRVRALPTPPVGPRAHSFEGMGQGDATKQLEDMSSQLELRANEIRRQRRQGGHKVRLRSPYRQVNRGMKKLLMAVSKLLEALKKTIASCLIIKRILELICGLGELFWAGSEDEMVEKVQAARGGVKTLAQELRERRKGRTRV